MITRRAFLGGLTASLALSPRRLWAGEAAPSLATLPLSIVNSTGQYANGSIWVYIVGNDASGRQVYSRGDGVARPIALSDNGSDGFTDYSIPLGGGSSTSLSLPNMSGRVYFALGQKLKFRVVSTGGSNVGLQYPAGWVSSDPNYNILHDFLEFTFNGSGMFCNTTMVDQFSVPLSIQLHGSQNQTTGSIPAGGRAAIFNAISAQSGFSSLLLSNQLRVIAPGHGIEAGLFSSSYFDGYTNDVWNHYASNDLHVNVNGTTYTGRVSGGTLNFDGGVRAFAKPTTLDIFYCNGALLADAPPSGPVAAILGAAFNRSTLLSNSNQPATSASTFYQTAVTNHYARIIHAHTSNGQAYGFPFDDVAGFASYIQDTAPTSATLTLTPF